MKRKAENGWCCTWRTPGKWKHAKTSSTKHSFGKI